MKKLHTHSDLEDCYFTCEGCNKYHHLDNAYYIDSEGIYVCESCLKVRGKSESNVCPVSTMSDLLKMVEGSDKVLVFG